MEAASGVAQSSAARPSETISSRNNSKELAWRLPGHITLIELGGGYEISGQFKVNGSHALKVAQTYGVEQFWTVRLLTGDPYIGVDHASPYHRSNQIEREAAGGSAQLTLGLRTRDRSRPHRGSVGAAPSAWGGPAESSSRPDAC